MRALRFTFLTAAALLAVPAIAGQPAHNNASAHVKPRHVTTHHIAPRANYAGIIVPMDEARVITFQKPVATVFVGNTVIADVTIIDSHHAYVMGKTFGATNVIGLDIDRNPVVNQQITIANRMAGAVTVTRGPESYNYSCTQYHCETNPRPGDPKNYFDNTEVSTASHEDQALKAAAVQTGPGGGQ